MTSVAKMHDNLQLRTIVIASIICAVSGLVTPPEEYSIEDVTRVGTMFFVYSYSFMELSEGTIGQDA